MISRDRYPITTAVLVMFVIVLLCWWAIGMFVFIPAGQWTLWVLTATIIFVVGFVILCASANAEEKGGY